MKKLLTLIVTVLTLTTAWSQTELKINPIGALFSSPDVSAEFGVADNIGIEPYIGASWYNLTVDNTKYKSKGFGYGVNGKYYFSPEKGIDKFYAGLYLRGGSSNFKSDSSSANFTRNRLSLGLSLGYKWVSRNNVVFEIGAGVGRKLYSKYSNESGTVDISKIPLLNLDGYFKFAVGYRFGGGSSADSGKKKVKY